MLPGICVPLDNKPSRRLCHDSPQWLSPFLGNYNYSKSLDHFCYNYSISAYINSSSAHLPTFAPCSLSPLFIILLPFSLEHVQHTLLFLMHTPVIWLAFLLCDMLESPVSPRTCTKWIFHISSGCWEVKILYFNPITISNQCLCELVFSSYTII